MGNVKTTHKKILELIRKTIETVPFLTYQKSMKDFCSVIEQLFWYNFL